MPQSPQQRPLDALSKMKIALADAVTKWAELEDALALLLSEALGSEQRLGPLIYFAPVATKTRLAIVDAVLPLYLKSDPRFWQFCPISDSIAGQAEHRAEELETVLPTAQSSLLAELAQIPSG